MKACANGALGAGTDVYHENIFDWRLGVSSPISVNKKGREAKLLSLLENQAKIVGLERVEQLRTQGSLVAVSVA